MEASNTRQITVGDCIVALTTGTTSDGQPFISLGGINCDLEGVEPGLYDLKRHRTLDDATPSELADHAAGKTRLRLT